MKKITNLIIIDASSSMQSKTQAVKDGLKDLFKTIKQASIDNPEIKTRTIVTQFSYPEHFKVLVDTKGVDKLTNKIADSYVASGNTALFDAIGASFELVGKKQDGVFVNILTDGQENSSIELNTEAVKKLFAKANEKKWGLTFMATTQEAIESIVSMGVSRSNTMSFMDNNNGVFQASMSRGASMNTYYSNVTKSTSKDDLDNENLIVQKKEEKKEG